MSDVRTKRLLGLAARSGGICCGEGAVLDGIRCGKARLVIIASDASDNTKKKFYDKCAYYGVRAAELFDRFELGRCVGREFAVSLAVTNAELAKETLKLIGGEESRTELS